MPVQVLVIDVAIVVCALLLLVRPGLDPSPPPPPPDAGSYQGRWIAISALASAFLPPPLSIAPVTVCGILVLQGRRLPLVTGGCGVRRWLPWVLWSLAPLACPVAIAGVMTCAHPGTGPPAWAFRVADGLWAAHLGVLVVAAIAVVVLARGGRRWLAWAAIGAHGVFALPFIGFATGALMERAGVMMPSLCLAAVPCILVWLGPRAHPGKRVSIILAMLTAAGLNDLGASERIPPHTLTEIWMRDLKRRVLRYARSHGELPGSLAALPKAGLFDDGFFRDVWGNEIIFEVSPSGVVSFRSLGRDAKAGGSGNDADFVRSFPARDAQGKWSDELVEWSDDVLTKIVKALHEHGPEIPRSTPALGRDPRHIP